MVSMAERSLKLSVQNLTPNPQGQPGASNARHSDLINRKGNEPMKTKNRKEVNGQAIRNDMYNALDGFSGLRESITDLNDPKATALRVAAQAAFDALYSHLEDNYLWD
jgi:hypothetical protein